MSINEYREMLAATIIKLENQMYRIRDCETDCDRSLVQRDFELSELRKHRVDAVELLLSTYRKDQTQDVA